MLHVPAERLRQQCQEILRAWGMSAEHAAITADILAETPRYRESEGQGRPARLYRYKRNAVMEVKARRLFPWG